MQQTLSHSQIETWESCRRKWRLIKRDRVSEAPSTHLILGTAVHEAIEQDMRRRSRSVRQSPSQTGLMAIAAFSRSLTRELTRRDPTGLLAGDATARMRRRGQAILSAYAAHAAPRLYPLPDAIEESFAVDVPGTNGWQFTGRMDARTQTPGRAPVICDFKTGKPWDARAQERKPQATAYLWAESVRPLDGPRAESVAFVTLPDMAAPDGTISASVDIRQTRRAPHQLSAYAAHVRDVAEQIGAATAQAEATGDADAAFPANPSVLCGWCGVLGACQVGQAYLRANGRGSQVPGVTVGTRGREGEVA